MARTAMWSSAVLLLLAACGPKEPAEQPAAAAPPAAEPAPAAELPPVEPAANETPHSEAPQSSLHEQCHEVCKLVAAKCSKAVADTCELNCQKYDKTPKACEPYAREALSCAVSARDLPCANMAPESCAKQFRAVNECQRSPDTFQVKAEEKKKLPEGWGIYDEGSFSVPAPGGITKSTVGDETVWSTTVGAVRYSVRKLPPLTEKLTPKSQVRLANSWLGPCTLKMKLHGQVDKGDRSTLHYDAGCKDGGERHGMVHVTPSALYIVGVEAPAGERAEMETFRLWVFS